MVLGWTKSSRAEGVSPIAIDFGADSLKVLQVVKGRAPQLIAAACAVLPEEVRRDPGKRFGFFADALRMLLKHQHFRGRRVICSIPSYQTLVHHFQLSASGDDAQTQTEVEQLLRQRLNVDPSRMVVRTFPITTLMREGEAKREVICIAAGSDTLLRYIDLVGRAKLEVVGVHCEQAAVLGAFNALYPEQTQAAKTVAFVDLGSSTTKVVIARQGSMRVARTIHVAGDHFNRQYASAQEISYADARAARMAQCKALHESPAHAAIPLPPASGEVRSIAEQVATAVAEPRGKAAHSHANPTAAAPLRSAGVMASNPTEESVECLIDEVHLAIRYHQSLFAQEPVESLVFLGGESRQTRLCQRIAKALRIGAQLGDPMAKLSSRHGFRAVTGVDLHEPQPGWAVPLGLCFCEANL